MAQASIMSARSCGASPSAKGVNGAGDSGRSRSVCRCGEGSGNGASRSLWHAAKLGRSFLSAAGMDDTGIGRMASAHFE